MLMTNAYLSICILGCLLPTLSEAQWYSPKTNNNTIYNDSTAKKVIWSLYEALQRGKSFESVAFNYSQDPTSFREGGKLDPILINDLVKEYYDAVRQLGEGQTSRPFKSEYGYSIIQLLSKEDGKCIIRNILIRIN